MDEYAYGFVTENSHYGRLAIPAILRASLAVPAGVPQQQSPPVLYPSLLVLILMVPSASPAALCGVFGFKPTYRRLSRAGAYLFSSSLDCVGPFGRSIRDMALLYDILQGPDSRDPVCTQRPPELCSSHLNQGIEGLRIAVADGYFARGAEPEAMDAVEIVAKALTIVLNCGSNTEKTTNPPKIGGLATVTIPESDRARAAAFHHYRLRGGKLAFRQFAIAPSRLRSGHARSLFSGNPDPCDLVLASPEIQTVVPRSNSRNIPTHRHHPRTRNPDSCP